MELNKLAVKLNRILHLDHNKGINNTAMNIINHLIMNEIELAQNEYGVDGDKIPRYTEWGMKFHTEMYNNLGCRLHRIKNCQNVFCKRGN